MADKLRFRIRLPWAETKIVPFHGAEMWFGRDPECSFVIDDPEVSRRHALFTIDAGGRVTVTDLGSTNGTFVRGVPIQDETILTPGTSVRIGETIITLELTGSRNMETFSAQISESWKHPYEIGADQPVSCEDASCQSLIDFERELIESIAQANFLDLILDRIKQMMAADNAYLLISQGISGYENPALSISKGGKLIIPSNIIDDISTSSAGMLAPSEDTPLTEAFGTTQINSFLCVPIRENDTNWGVIYLDRVKDKNLFSENQYRLLCRLSYLAAMCLKKEHACRVVARERDLLRVERERWNRLNLSAGDIPVKSQNRKFQQLLFKILRVAGTQHPVLLYGPPGSGRSMLASRIHNTSSRKEGRFIEVNCSSIPSSLMEEELFGADVYAGMPEGEIKHGFIELANKGTIYLKDISTIPVNVQEKLVQLINTGKIKRKGSEHHLSIDVRIIASIDVELSKMLTAETLAQDFFDILSPLTIEVPPLKQRPEDILLLAKYYLRQYLPSNKPISEFSQEVTSILCRYSWPGNIEELSQTMHYIAAICRDERIELGDLPRYLLEQAVTPFDPKTPLRDQLDRLEAEIIRTALERNRNIVTRAAKELGLSESTLRYRMQRLKIQ